MDAATKKTLLVKLKAVGRCLKEYNSYKQEVDAYDQTLVAQDKKQADFYKESTEALEAVKKSLVDFVQGLESFMIENKEEIEGEDDPNVVAELNKGKENVEKAKLLFPADL